jgi:phage-related protein (TIGR01555 family)
MQFSDSLQNLVSGLGTDRDKATFSTFTGNLLGRPELLNMYTSDWIAGTIVDAPADDMTREWRSWKAGKRHLKSIETSEKQLNVVQVVNRCLKQARLYGGSALLIGTGDPDPSKPLDPESVQKGGIKYLHSLSRWEIFAGDLDRDPVSPTFGEPTMYQLTAGGAADPSLASSFGPVLIHPSRIVRFQGIQQLELTWSIDGWGHPILQRVYDAVRNAASVTSNIASLAYEAKVDIIKIPGLTQNVSNPEYRNKLLARLALAQRGKSINSALLMDALEEWDQKQLHFAGYPEVIAKFMEIAAGAANMPVTRLLGKSPTGLNSTGEADLRHYYDTLSSKQKTEMGPALNRLDQVLIRHAGAKPSDVWYEWNPLWQMSDREKAAVAMQKAQTSQIYSVVGVMPPIALQEAVQAQLIDDGTYPGLEQILESHKGEKAEPMLAQEKAVDPNLAVKMLNDPTASHDELWEETAVAAHVERPPIDQTPLPRRPRRAKAPTA